MKTIFTLFMCVLMSACVKTDTPAPAVPEDPDWIRLEAPTGGEALDVAGNIDSTLFVATMFKLYRTIDQGKTWDLIWSGNTGPNAVLINKDTLWHMRGILTSVNTASKSKTVSTINPSYYSLDGGTTWQSRISYADFGRQINSVKASDGILYTIKENIGSDSYINPSTIVKQISGAQEIIRFPFKHIINSLLLDSKNRLYVAVSGTQIPETDHIYCCPRDLPSVIYVSRQPLP